MNQNKIRSCPYFAAKQLRRAGRVFFEAFSEVEYIEAWCKKEALIAGNWQSIDALAKKKFD